MENNYTPLILSYDFSAAASSVFDAWTKPEIMKLWLFKSDSNEIVSIKIDLHAGGNFSILELNGYEKIDHYGTFLEIKSSEKLIFTLEVPWHFPGVSTVKIDIIQKTTNCEMIFNQSGIDTSVTEESWKKMFEKLRTVLE